MKCRSHGDAALARLKCPFRILRGAGRGLPFVQRSKLHRLAASLDVPADESILQVLLRSGLEVPSTCESGTLRYLQSEVSRGIVDY
jgi:hypothetical protein